MTTYATTAIYMHDGEPLKARLNDNNPERPFATIDLNDDGTTYIVIHNRTEAGALVKAALAARGLLPGPEPESAVCASCGATADLLGVHDTGGDGTLAYYCADLEACADRRAAREHEMRAAVIP